MPELTTDIALSVIAKLTATSDLAQTKSPHAINFGTSWPSGVGAGQADMVFGDERTLSASATEDLDLAGGLTGVLGTALTFARVKALVVVPSAANTNSVVVGGAATNTWVGPFGAATHTTAVPPGGLFMEVNPSAAGWPVTAGTGDLLKIANSGAGTSVTYRVFILGASA